MTEWGSGGEWNRWIARERVRRRISEICPVLNISLDVVHAKCMVKCLLVPGTVPYVIYFEMVMLICAPDSGSEFFFLFSGFRRMFFHCFSGVFFGFFCFFLSEGTSKKNLWSCYE